MGHGLRLFQWLPSRLGVGHGNAEMLCGGIMMAESTVDYSRVDIRLHGIVAMLGSLEQQIGQHAITGTARFLDEIDLFRNNVGIEIERQGKRE